MWFCRSLGELVGVLRRMGGRTGHADADYGGRRGFFGWFGHSRRVAEE